MLSIQEVEQFIHFIIRLIWRLNIDVKNVQYNASDQKGLKMPISMLFQAEHPGIYTRISDRLSRGYMVHTLRFVYVACVYTYACVRMYEWMRLVITPFDLFGWQNGTLNYNIYVYHSFFIFHFLFNMNDSFFPPQTICATYKHCFPFRSSLCLALSLCPFVQILCFPDSYLCEFSYAH